MRHSWDTYAQWQGCHRPVTWGMIWRPSQVSTCSLWPCGITPGMCPTHIWTQSPCLHTWGRVTTRGQAWRKIMEPGLLPRAVVHHAGSPSSHRHLSITSQPGTTVSWGHLATSGDIFDWHNWGSGAPSQGWRPALLFPRPTACRAAPTMKESPRRCHWREVEKP